MGVEKSDKEAKPIFVLDKSFAQGAKYGELEDLASRYIVVVTSSFYYESFTTLSESRLKIFAGFPQFHRMDTLQLYRDERDTRMPVSSVESVPLEINSDIVSGKRVLTANEQLCNDDFEACVVLPGVQFWKKIIETGVIGFEASEVTKVKNNLPGFIKLCARLLEADFIRQVAEAMNIPHATLISDRWYTFRWVQARLLHGLTLRYLSVDSEWSCSEEDLEHDVHDIDYLTLGLHAQCFATDESISNYKKLGWKFKFLCPEGHLLQTKNST